jgi:hypothetical protein
MKMDANGVSIYIVTYRNSADLNSNIASILRSGAKARINVINNHTTFFLEPEHEQEVNVLHNYLRPDFSTGHLARNWNQALLHGFRSLGNPASEIVITVQDDVIFKQDWYPRLIELHHRYDFITMGPGDAFCSYLPDSVKKVGLWDERFCNIGGQEADYFLRSLIYNRNGSSINDLLHGRLHNAVESNSVSSTDEFRQADSVLITVPPWNLDRKEVHIDSAKFYALSDTVFKHKWGVTPCHWAAEHYAIRSSLVTNYIMYPYFECEVESLSEKKYLVAEEEFQSTWETAISELRKKSEEICD